MDESKATGGASARSSASSFESLVVDQATVSGEGPSAYALREGTNYLRRQAMSALKNKPTVLGKDQKPRRLADSSTAAERYALQRHLARAREIAGHMTAAAVAEDIVGLAAAGVSLTECLRELWRLRKAREDEWAEIVNFLQSALARGVLERVGVSQCRAIERVIDEHLASGAVSDDQPARVRRILREARLDPWQAISQPEGAADGEGVDLR